MIERSILSSLLNDIEYTRKVIPYLKREYFLDVGEQVTFNLIKDHFVKYNAMPTKESIFVDLTEKKIKENFYERAKEVIDSLGDSIQNRDWLIDTTENFCKKRAFFNAIRSASELLDKDDTELYHGALDTVSKALSVSFDGNLGSDYFENVEDRYDSYHSKNTQMPLTIDIFNKVTKGGFVTPSLTVFIAPTGVGKSLFLCNIAADLIKQGKNVLYFTMEMSEEQVEKRIDLNLLDLTKDQIMVLAKEQFVHRVANIKKATHGKLKVKEYPSGSAHAGHFRYFIEEIKLKEGFIPDAIVVDYLNICASMRTVKSNGLYDYMGSISVEIRGLGQEFNVPVFTATQTNREGSKSSDFSSTDVADSYGIAFNADYIYGIIETEELAKMMQMKIKRLKDRYQDYISWMPSFIIGVDKEKQRIYDIQQPSNDEEVDSEEIDNQFMSLIVED